MATIHPSRAGLVPQSDSNAGSSRESDLKRKLLEQRARSRDGREQGRDSPTYESYDGGKHDGGSRGHYDARSHDHERENDWRAHRSETHFFEDRNGVPPPGAWPQRDPERRRLPTQHADAGGWLESRQEQRKHSNVTIWPPSPTSPYRSEGEEKERRRKERSDRHHRKSKKHHHHHISRDDRKSSRYSDESDDSHDRREYKRRHKERRDRSRSPTRKDADSEEERRRQRRKKGEREARQRNKDEDKSRHRHRSPRHESHESESRSKHDLKQNEEKRPTIPDVVDQSQALVSRQVDADVAGHQNTGRGARSSRVIGPQMPEKAAGSKTGADQDGRGLYGKALLPGEGSAMANFVQDGQRIPRRGEIGLKSDQIEAFENVGFVMSGSRHQRMNAVRMRKENQVYSAEEQRTMLKLIAEEKQKKEAQLIEQFKDMVDSIE